MIPVEYTFWAHPHPEFAVKTQPGKGWQFPQGAFTAGVIRLPDWYGPWNDFTEASWHSECCHDPRVAGVTSATVGVQLCAMTYDCIPVVMAEYECLCNGPTSAPYSKNVTAELKKAFALAVPARNNALQLGVRVKSDNPALVYSSRLMIAWKA